MGTITLTISALSLTELEEQVTDIHRRFQATALGTDTQAAASDMDPPRKGRSRIKRTDPAGSGGDAGGVSAAAPEGAAEQNTADAPDLFAGDDAAPAGEDQAEAAQADVVGDPDADASAESGDAPAGEGGPADQGGVGGEPESVEADAPVTVEALVAAGKSLAAAKGFDAVGGVMAKFGISRMSDCPEDKRAELLAAFDGAL